MRFPLPWVPVPLHAVSLALLLVLAVGGAGCTLGRAAVEPVAPAAPFDAAPYRDFVVPAPLLPFQVRGSAQFSLRGQRESGELWVQALPGPLYALELRARLTGGLALEVRFDPARVLLLDYLNETYLLLPNTPDVRRRLFDVDLSPEEFQTLLTGRITEARFVAWDGTRGEDGEVTLRNGRERHRFRLDAHGLPASWAKERDGIPVFHAEFREYLALLQPEGPPLRLPRRVRLLAAEGTPGAKGGGVLALGVHSFTPGQAATPRPTDTLPPAAARFAPGELPPEQ